MNEGVVKHAFGGTAEPTDGIKIDVVAFCMPMLRGRGPGSGSQDVEGTESLDGPVGD